jgi:hypothetical protein
MDKELLRQVVLQQKKELSKIEETVTRELLSEVLEWFKDNRIMILTGIRRSGKSTLLRQTMNALSEYCYVNFEDERFIGFKAENFELLNEVLIEIYGNPKIYFFDEIQNVEQFEVFVRRLQDQGKKIVMTGSNASLLSSELGTRLTGRYKSFEVYPFSFSEYLAFKKVQPEKEWFYLAEKKVGLIKLFGEYLSNGGMPEYLKNRDMEYIRTVYENIIYRDIVARYSIKKQKTIKELVNLLTTNISSQFTYNSLRKDLGLSNAVTVKEYIHYLCGSYLFFELQKFSFSAKKQLNSPKKIYSIDPAFIHLTSLSFSTNKGRLLEDIVLIELKRRKKEAYYYSEKKECDFIVKEGAKISEAIQVCHAINETNKEREVNGLLEAMEQFKLKEGLILTQEQEGEIKNKNKKIRIMPAWKWMLKPDK